MRLAEKEVLRREQRAAERRIKAAKFPVINIIVTFQFAQQPLINEPLAHELLRCEYVGRKENVLLVGNPGTGKAHLASALVFADCALGRKVLFYTVTELVTELIECREERRLQRMQKQLQRLDLIVLDELGYTPFSKARAELLFEVISRAYEYQQGNHNQNRSNGSDKACAGAWVVRPIVALVMHRKHHFFWHRHRFAGVVNRFAGA